MNRYTKTIAAMAVGLAAITAHAAVNSDDAKPATSHHHMAPKSPFMHAIQQLNLSDAQRQSIHSIMENSHTQAKAAFSNNHDEFSGLMNPGDPNYQNAVKAAEAAAAARIEQRSQIDTQIYSVLTPDQQKKLPEVLANMKDGKQHDRQHHGQWHPHDDASTNAPAR